MSVSQIQNCSQCYSGYFSNGTNYCSEQCRSLSQPVLDLEERIETLENTVLLLKDKLEECLNIMNTSVKDVTKSTRRQMGADY